MQMQTKVLAALQERIENAGLEYVTAPKFANTGRFHAMSGFTNVAVWSYDFQDSYATVTPVVGERETHGPGQYFRYADNDGIAAMFAAFELWLDAAVKAAEVPA